ncbi:MAG: hypothetical protein LBH09_04510, partial [Peptococcaceae bacterium]|nr:hypothetical protein [Peptococcaceae bacterium]
PNGYDYRIIRLSDVEGRYEAEVLYDSAEYGNSVSYYWSILAPAKISVYEGFATSGASSSRGPGLDYSLYRLKFSKMGEPLLRDLLKITGNMERLLSRAPLVESYSYPEYDRVFIREEGYESELYLCKGRYVVHALYKGDKALADVFSAVNDLFCRLPE